MPPIGCSSERAGRQLPVRQAVAVVVDERLHSGVDARPRIVREPAPQRAQLRHRKAGGVEERGQIGVLVEHRGQLGDQRIAGGVPGRHGCHREREVVGVVGHLLMDALVVGENGRCRLADEYGQQRGRRRFVSGGFHIEW